MIGKHKYRIISCSCIYTSTRLVRQWNEYLHVKFHYTSILSKLSWNTFTPTHLFQVIFNGEPVDLTRDDVSMLLLSELGTRYTSHTLNQTFAWKDGVSRIMCLSLSLLIFIRCYSNQIWTWPSFTITSRYERQSSSINAAEFHQFLVTDDKDLGSKRTRLRLASTVVHRVSSDLGYLLGLSFTLALCILLLLWIFTTTDYDMPTPYENVFYRVKCWLYNIGTLGELLVCWSRLICCQEFLPTLIICANAHFQLRVLQTSLRYCER